MVDTKKSLEKHQVFFFIFSVDVYIMFRKSKYLRWSSWSIYLCRFNKKVYSWSIPSCKVELWNVGALQVRFCSKMFGVQEFHTQYATHKLHGPHIKAISRHVVSNPWRFGRSSSTVVIGAHLSCHSNIFPKNPHCLNRLVWLNYRNLIMSLLPGNCGFSKTVFF